MGLPTQGIVGAEFEQVAVAFLELQGAVFMKSPQNTFWGDYADYFQDPDWHVLEIAWNPQWPIDDQP